MNDGRTKNWGSLYASHGRLNGGNSITKGIGEGEGLKKIVAGMGHGRQGGGASCVGARDEEGKRKARKGK